MKRRLEPPTSSRIVLTRDSNTSLVPFPSTSPVIGVSTKSSTSIIGVVGAAASIRPVEQASRVDLIVVLAFVTADLILYAHDDQAGVVGSVRACSLVVGAPV